MPYGADHRSRSFAECRRQSFACAIDWSGEPAISDILRDPIVQALMTADRVNRDELARLMTAPAADKWQ